METTDIDKDDLIELQEAVYDVDKFLQKRFSSSYVRSEYTKEVQGLLNKLRTAAGPVFSEIVDDYLDEELDEID